MKPSDDQVGGDHYKSMPIQPHYFCHVNKLGALESNVVKYICRHAAKNGKADLLKARHYIDLLLEWQYGDVNEVKGGMLVPCAKPGDVIPALNPTTGPLLCKHGFLVCKPCGI